MILGDPTEATPAALTGQLTIDEVFRRFAARQPDALALCDPPNREAFTDGAPRRLTYAAAEHAVSATAARLHSLALPPDSVVGIQLPNIAETILTMLGVLRAGLIAAPLPLLWRRADAVAALSCVSAKALITCGRVGAFEHCHLARQIAAEVFSIRYVCGFGTNLPDGVVALDDVVAAPKPEALDREPRSNAAAHLAAITFDVGADGVVAVARSHAELLAGGLGVLLESRLAEPTTMLSAVLPSSFAGICVTLTPWLLSGSALLLHQPFDAEVFAQQRREGRCATLILPGPVAAALAAMEVPAGEGLTRVIAPWRSPELLADSEAWRDPTAIFVDVSSFGEAAAVPARRGASGRPSAFGLGPVTAPRDRADGIAIADLARTEVGTVAARGPMVPRGAYPPGAKQSGLPCFKTGPGGLVDTGYPCRIDSVTGALAVTGRPAGIVSVGGYRFLQREVEDRVGRVERGAKLAALPDPLLGQRLIANAADRKMMAAALAVAGLNPLVAGVVRDRSRRAGPAAA
jgi:acyl-CoA synthetase (AMP-forming)/AMP-acid ligase II